MTAIPDAATELEASSSYVLTFGSSVPSAKFLAGELVTAASWTALRTAAESFLIYTRSMEAITWKSARTDLEKLDVVFQAIALQDQAAIAAFPATQRLLDVPRVIAARAAATRARNAKAAKASKPTSNPTTPPVVTAATPPVATAPMTVATAPAILAGTTAGGTGTH